MRIAFFSDLHGNVAALERIIPAIEAEAVNLVINLGDSFAGAMFPRETAELLFSQPITHLRGNHERIMTSGIPHMPMPDQFAVDALEEKQLALIAGFAEVLRPRPDILALHGIPGDDTTGFLETADHGGLRVATDKEIDARIGKEAATLILCGHTHVPRASRRPSGQLVLCPGSAHRPLFENNPTLDLQWSPGTTCYAIADDGPGSWRAELVVIGPHRGQARVAIG